jgi:AcrR family transcriptional regulator
MNKDDIIKNEILEGAAKLFQKWGYNKTTVEDIAKACRKAKSSLYYYYKDKEEIFSEVVMREERAVLKVINDKMSKEDSSAEKMRVYIETFLQEIEKSSNVYNVVCGELAGNAPLFRKLSCQIDSMHEGILKKIISTGINDKEFRLPGNTDIASVIHVIINTIGGLLIDKILVDKTESMKLGRVMACLLLEGIKAEKS